MPLWALVKVLSLGYLLSALCLSLTALAWRGLRRSLSPALRAGALFWGFTASFALCVTLVALIWAGVVSRVILMTTPYFHRLMYGGWAAGIALSGVAVLLISLLLAQRAWRRSHAAAPSTTRIGAVGKLPLLASEAVAAAALVGVWRPAILVNPAYWEATGPELRKLTLEHELCHQQRADNPRKLILQFIAGLYFFLPWLRGIPAQYASDCEYAVDAACCGSAGRGAYLALLRHSAAQLPGRAASKAAMGLGNALAARIAAIELGAAQGQAGSLHRRRKAALCSAGVVFALCTLGSLPALAILSHPTLRCLVACYLGY